MSSVELQFEFEWLKRAINCSKWAISLQVGMRSLKTAGREEDGGGGRWDPTSEVSGIRHTSPGKWRARFSSHHCRVVLENGSSELFGVEHEMRKLFLVPEINRISQYCIFNMFVAMSYLFDLSRQTVTGV